MVKCVVRGGRKMNKTAYRATRFPTKEFDAISNHLRHELHGITRKEHALNIFNHYEPSTATLTLSAFTTMNLQLQLQGVK